LTGFAVAPEEFLGVVHKMGADALEDAAAVGEAIDLKAFAGGR